MICNPFGDLMNGGAGREDVRHSEIKKEWDVGVRDDPTSEHDDVRRIAIAERLDQFGEQRHMSAREDRNTHELGILLDRNVGNMRGSLMQPGVDDLMAGITKGAGNHLGTAIVSIQAGLSDHDSCWSRSRQSI